MSEETEKIESAVSDPGFPGGHGAKQSFGARFLIVAAAFVIVVAGLRAADSLVVPLLLSVFFAVISAPPLMWLEAKGAPTWLAMVIVLAGLVGAGTAVGTLIGSSLNDFTQSLPHYQVRLHEETKDMANWLREKGLEISTESATKMFDPRAGFKLAGNMLTGLGGMLSNTFLILLTVMFILLEASGFPDKLHAISGKSTLSLENLQKMMDNVKHYMAIKTVMSMATGIIIAVWLNMLGVDYPLLWGVLAFLLNYIPNIGSIIAAIPAVLLAFIQLGPAPAIFSAAGYFVTNGVIGNLIEPRFMGRGLGLSTLVVFVSLVFWGWVLGPVGMLLSVPLTMTVKIALESNDDTRWIAILLSSEPPTAIEAV